jgi:hypothetical protein
VRKLFKVNGVDQLRFFNAFHLDSIARSVTSISLEIHTELLTICYYVPIFQGILLHTWNHGCFMAKKPGMGTGIGSRSDTGFASESIQKRSERSGRLKISKAKGAPPRRQELSSHFDSDYGSANEPWVSNTTTT